MTRPWPVLAAVLLVMGPAAPGHPPSAETGLPDDFAPLVRRLMARDQIPGVAVGVVERGHLSFARGFGYRDMEKHLPVTPSAPAPMRSRQPRSLSWRTRGGSRSTLPCAGTFPTFRC